MAKSSTYLKAISFLASQRFDDADALMKKSEIADRERLEYTGDVHFYKHEQQKAIDAYNLLFSKYPKSQPARYYYLVAVKMEREGRITDAFNYYRSAIEAESTFVDPYIELGGLLFKVKDYEGAVKCMERALEFDPNDLRIYKNLKTIYTVLSEQNPAVYSERKKRLDAAYASLERQLGPLPDNHQW